MKQILANTLRQLLASKKVVTLFATLVVAIAAMFILPVAQKYGLPITEGMIQSAVFSIFGLGGLTIAGQGLKERGKEAALINAISADPRTDTTATLAQQGLLGFGSDIALQIGVSAILSQIKGPNKRGKIRATAAEVTKQSLIAYRDDEEFLRVIHAYLPSA